MGAAYGEVEEKDAMGEGTEQNAGDGGATAGGAGATALVIQSTPNGGPGRWEGWLREGGLDLDVVPAYDGAPVPESLAGRQALVVLGGGYLPDDDARAPWLPATRALVQEALATGTPVFGICLGGQMLAHVAGGAVKGSHGHPEYGSTPLRLRDAAAEDPLFQGLPAAPTAIEHHVDAITELPPGAHWLVESDTCPYQAFRLGDGPAWGVQFHPETTADRIRHWDAANVESHGFDRDTLHRTALADEPAATDVWHTVALRFAAQATGRAGAA
ncbi:type 1 glutamine amidotransferase [Streptomyces sp. NPDC020917]|uniref:type 1 glutamine amidotransferase n=1 Tax=Streptomyces sp. NPDC020917 TaxID=3365102 RepID=UPI00378AE824